MTTLWHPNQKLAGTTQPWNSSDNADSYQRMVSDPVHADYFKQQGWTKDSITYRFNQHGFRGDEFSTDNNLVVLGCSFTMGIGLPEQDTWPALVADALGLNVCNLSWGGNSLDGCFRMAEFWIPKLKPQAVVMLAPASTRHDLVTYDEVVTFIPEVLTEHSQDWYIKQYTVNTENSRLNAVKNRLAIKEICDQTGSEFFVYDSMREMSKSREEVGYARDYMHAGPVGHRMLADKIIRDYHGR